MPKKKTAWRRKGLAIGLGGALIAGTLWVGNDKLHLFPVPGYEVERVIDGDTFITKEGQRIRVASTEAPELANCGGPKAKARLEELILDQPLYLKIVYQDFYHRQVSLVYSGKTFVNEQMLKDGYSYYYRASPGEIGEKLQHASAEARKQAKGIFGPECTQIANPVKPQCNIKANIGQKDKIYYLPDCGVYPNVIVELYKGDQWFCTEAEAIKAGFRKPSQCP